MRYPKYLPEGGTIGLAAPSFGAATEPYRSAFQHAMEVFQSKGFQTKLGLNCYADQGIGISNTPQLCAQELMEQMLDPNNDVVLSVGGGELMCEILPYMDFERLREAEPKLFMGFSDNTNMTFLLNTLCDTAAIYGPCAPAFGMEPWHPVIQDAWELLRGQKRSVTGFDLWESESEKTEEAPLTPYHVTEKKVLTTYPKEQVTMSGRLLGGCLDCLSVLCGTRFDQVEKFNETYGTEGILWFLEACELWPMDIRRTMWKLRQSGWFDKASGFLIGRPICYGQEAFGVDHHQAFYEMLQDLDVPVVLDVDLGHLPPSMPILSGSYGTVQVDGNDITIQYDQRK